MTVKCVPNWILDFCTSRPCVSLGIHNSWLDNHDAKLSSNLRIKQAWEYFFTGYWTLKWHIYSRDTRHSCWWNTPHNLYVRVNLLLRHIYTAALSPGHTQLNVEKLSVIWGQGYKWQFAGRPSWYIYMYMYMYICMVWPMASYGITALLQQPVDKCYMSCHVLSANTHCCVAD